MTLNWGERKANQLVSILGFKQQLGGELLGIFVGVFHGKLLERSFPHPSRTSPKGRSQLYGHACTHTEWYCR